MTTIGHEDSCRGDENVLKLIMVMVAEFCVFTKNTGLYTLKG